MNGIRYVASTLAGLVLFATAGCGGSKVNGASREYPMGGTTENSAPQGRSQETRQGLSTGQKVMLLAGAAAVYYMYKKHQNTQGTGPDGQYYRSKNGQIYYRDKSGKPHWVTPPQQPIQVPADEYSRVTGQNTNGYNGGVMDQAPNAANW